MPSDLVNHPQLLKQLAAAYGVSCKTMKQWIVLCERIPFSRPAIGYYYSPAEVRQIVEALGEP